MQVFGEDQSETDIKSKSGGSRFWHLSQDNCLNFIHHLPRVSLTYKHCLHPKALYGERRRESEPQAYRLLIVESSLGKEDIMQKSMFTSRIKLKN